MTELLSSLCTAAPWRAAGLAVVLWAAALPPLGAQPAAAPATAAMPAIRAGAPVTLNFVNADIDMVSRAMATLLDRQIVVDPRVKGQITITSERAVPPREAWRHYLAALRGLGFAVVDSTGLLKVVPEADAKVQASPVITSQSTSHGDQVLTQIFRLEHENSNNLVTVLRPLITPNNTINANPGSNTLVITDYADNLQRLGKIIAALDQPAASDVEILPLRHQLASDIAPLVQRLLDGASGGLPGAPVGALPGGTPAASVLAEPRSNSLIVRAASASRIAQVKALTEKLDLPIAGGGPAGNIWVVYLKNADAVKLAEVLRATLAGGAGGSGSGSAAANTNTARGGLTGALNANQGGAAQATTPVAASPGPSTGGQIQADPSTNSLIISAPEPIYRQLRQVIDQLDTRRAQIYVESMIVKVDASKAADFGIQWQNLWPNSGHTRGIFAGTNFGTNGNLINLSMAAAAAQSSSDYGKMTSPGGGLNIGLVRKIGGIYTLSALARFLETNTGANVLSTPNLVALDNEEAKIVVGQNVPFITGSYTSTGAANGAANPFQTIDRKDVGLTLRIKSQVGEGGTVRMTIYQENSSVTQNTAAGLITDKSSLETTVVVDDGQMMVLGGLMKDEFTDSEGRIPGVSNIPLLGNLFRSDSRSRVKSNLMVFLRPVVIRDQSASDQLLMDRYDAIRAVQRQAQPEPGTLNSITDAPLLPAQPTIPVTPGLRLDATVGPPPAAASTPAPGPALNN